MAHNLVNKAAPGYGKWLECVACDCTKFSGYWWHGGHKSEQEPACGPPTEAWIKEAQELTLEDYE